MMVKPFSALAVVEIGEEQRRYAEELAEEIRSDKVESGFEDKGGHARKNPERSAQLGYLGETIFADWHGIERPELLEGSLDDGEDFMLGGNSVQVKTTETSYLILFPEHVRENDGVDAYSVVRIKEGRAWLYGGVSRERFVEESRVKDFGYGERLVMDAVDIPVKCHCGAVLRKKRGEQGSLVLCPKCSEGVPGS